jgi:hypothetical protein
MAVSHCRFASWRTNLHAGLKLAASSKSATAFSFQRLPVTRRLSAVDMEDLTSDERRILKKQHGLDGVANFTHVPHGMEATERFVIFRCMHRGLDQARRHSIDTDACRVPMAGDLVAALSPPLSQRCQNGGTPLIG